MNGGRHNGRGLLAAVGISFWLAMAGGVSAGPSAERIVGGDVANPADWPFMAALARPDGSHFCGGSVVADDTVVTAAHCMFDSLGRRLKPNSVRVVTGRPDLTDESAGEELKVAEITVHRKYLRRGRHDIAVLKLRSSTSAPAVVLPTHNEHKAETTPGSELRVAGWGGTKPDGDDPSDVLLDVPLFAISDAECRTHFSFMRPRQELCAFGEPQGNDRYDDSCFGDSGGPLIADAPRDALLVGIVSYGGYRCGVKKPGVYTQVEDNLGFIKRKAGLRR